MKRDMEVVRGILLWMEDDGDQDKKPTILNATPEGVVLEHMALLIEADFIDGQVIWHNRRGQKEVMSCATERLTWKGHEFISLLGKDSHWQKIKSKVIDAGVSWSVDTVIALLKSEASKTLLS